MHSRTDPNAMQAMALSLHRLTLLGGRVSAAAPVRVLSALHTLPASQQAISHRAACSAAGPPPAAAAAPPALLRRQRQRPQLPRLAASYSVVSDAGGEQGNSGSGKSWRLIIYSKEGCCLCDGLKEKVGREGSGRSGCRGRASPGCRKHPTDFYRGFAGCSHLGTAMPCTSWLTVAPGHLAAVQVEQLLERAQFLPSAFRCGSAAGSMIWAGTTSKAGHAVHEQCSCPKERPKPAPMHAPCRSKWLCIYLSLCCSTAELEVRDITSRPEWEAQYSMTIPVLAAAAADGSGEVRVTAPGCTREGNACQA